MMERRKNITPIRLVRLDELFELRNGLSSTAVVRSNVRRNSNWIPYIRPSYRQNTSVDAYVNRLLVDVDYVFPKHTLYVSTNGAGSHTYSYISAEEFVPNSDVCVLLPLRPMSLQEKLYYSLCISRNRFKFSYGRKPKGERLASILIPEHVPDYVLNSETIPENNISFPEIPELNDKSADTTAENVLTTLDELFQIKNGIASSEVLRINVRRNSNWIPYIRPSYRQNTSVDAYVNRQLVEEDYVFPKHTLYVSTDGQGSHTFAYVSTEEFVPNSNVSVLLPRKEMTLREKLFYAMCISHNRFKFSYGRKPKGERLKTIMLPASIPERFNELRLDSVVSKL